ALLEPLPMIAIRKFELNESAPFPAGTPSEGLLTMEQINQSYGFIRYSTHLDRPRKGMLVIPELHDFAIVTQGGRRLGTLDRRLQRTSIEVDLNAEEPVTILVENMGRVNFGPQIANEWKGIQGKVLLASEELTGWKTESVPLMDPSALRFSKTMLPA